MKNAVRVRDIGTQKAGSRLWVKGWVRSIRRGKKFSFVVINDGSSLNDLQVVVDGTLETYSSVEKASVGAALAIEGVLVESPGKGQAFELQAEEVHLVGSAGEDYPLQKKGHSLEFLRTKAHLRPRTKTLGAVFRVRHVLSMATHRFFDQKGFYYVHSPIITGLDCEGAGELFQVSAGEKGDAPFFGIPTYLTVSGQLSAECFSQTMGKCYTFGPTFRSENSHTPRHLSEFWMIEPEVAFCDLEGVIDLAREYFYFLVKSALEECSEEVAFLTGQYAPDRLGQLESLVSSEGEVEVVDYGKAVEILAGSGVSFEYAPQWGSDLQTEHERYLTEEHFGKPVVVVDYPKEIKAFYMKQNDDGKTVRAMDFLLPGVGELMGGSQREDDGEKLKKRMAELSLEGEDYWWYLELRHYGTTPHAGFGLGLERAVMYVTGMENIRDVIPFPRFPRALSFNFVNFTILSSFSSFKNVPLIFYLLVLT